MVTTFERTVLEGIDRQDVFDAMAKEGGGFVSRLAEAWRCADMDNDRKLYTLFADYYRHYEQVVRAARAQGSTP